MQAFDFRPVEVLRCRYLQASTVNPFSATLSVAFFRGTSPGSMHRTLEFLIKHGYAVLLAWVFAEQLGIPVPSMPVLLAAGALAGAGRLSFWGSLVLVTFAAITADSVWYLLGKTKGIRILQLLCKI